jgi:hypothetical protein
VQYISFKATTIVAPGTAKLWDSRAEVINHRAEQAEPASIFHARFYYDTMAHERGCQLFCGEPIEEHSAGDQKYKGWKMVAAWTGTIVASWLLVIGCVVIARALLLN